MAGTPRVFISDSHDSDAHRARGLARCERRRRAAGRSAEPREFLRAQEAIGSDPAQRFTRKTQIAGAAVATPGHGA